jgi:hypothetical protein
MLLLQLWPMYSSLSDVEYITLIILGPELVMNSVCRAGIAYIVLVYTEFFSFQARTDWTRLYFIPSFPCQYEHLFAKFVFFFCLLSYFLSFHLSCSVFV